MITAIFIIGSIIFIATTTATFAFGMARMEEAYVEDAETAEATPEFDIKPASPASPAQKTATPTPIIRAEPVPVR